MIKTNECEPWIGLGSSTSYASTTWILTICLRKTVAAKIGLPPEQVFKTLAVHGDRNGICLAVISANQELNFKALANQTGNRKIDMLPLKEVQALTGYIRGGVTALACKKDYPVYIDELAEICDVISVSAGIRGLQILLVPADYIRAVKATLSS